MPDHQDSLMGYFPSAPRSCSRQRRPISGSNQLPTWPGSRFSAIHPDLSTYRRQPVLVKIAIGISHDADGGQPGAPEPWWISRTACRTPITHSNQSPPSEERCRSTRSSPWLAPDASANHRIGVARPFCRQEPRRPRRVTALLRRQSSVVVTSSPCCSHVRRFLGAVQ